MFYNSIVTVIERSEPRYYADIAGLLLNGSTTVVRETVETEILALNYGGRLIPLDRQITIDIEVIDVSVDLNADEDCGAGCEVCCSGCGDPYGEIDRKMARSESMMKVYELLYARDSRRALVG